MLKGIATVALLASEGPWADACGMSVWGLLRLRDGKVGEGVANWKGWLEIGGCG